MTAEIGVLNKRGIALAADSVVRIKDGKMYYNTANKLFSLSNYHPVGVMIYNNSEFMGYPIEILLKEYRKKLEDKSFETLKEYWEDFIKFLQKGFNEESNKVVYFKEINSFLEFLNKDITVKYEKQLENDFEPFDITIDKESYEDYVNKYITYQYKEYVNEYFKKDNNFNDMFDTIKNHIDNGIELDKTLHDALDMESLDKLVEICIMLLIKKYSSGIVIAGYGENELFPSLINGDLMAGFSENVKYKLKNDYSVTYENSSYLIPLAYCDAMETFMNGMDDSIKDKIVHSFKDYIYDTFDEFKKNNSWEDDFEKNVLGRIDDVLDEEKKLMFEMLNEVPKEELINIARTMINLESIKRKLSIDDSQVVGSPVDVALITKDDGFVWINNKDDNSKK